MIHRLSQSQSVREFQRSQLEFDLRPKTYIRHVSPVEFETLAFSPRWKPENVETFKLLELFFELLQDLSVVALPV